MGKEESSKLIAEKHEKFIARRMLAKRRGNGLKTFGNTNDFPTLLVSNQKAQLIMHRASSTSRVLVMHFRGKEYIEKDFDVDSSYLDFLRLCKRFFDIYSVRFKVIYGNSKKLNGDEDILFMMKEHEGVPDIHVYIEEDKTTPLLSFKLPEDNLSLDKTAPFLSSKLPEDPEDNLSLDKTDPLLSFELPEDNLAFDKTDPVLSFNPPEDNISLASTISSSSNPKVTKVRIIGDVKLNEKVAVTGDVTGGTEQASTVQMFITVSKNFDVEHDLQSISLPQTDKVFRIPSEAAGHYLVAKYTPVDEDGKFGDSVYAISKTYVKNSTPKEKRNQNVRGKNQVKEVEFLKSGEKLPIEFYNNRAVGDNHKCWSRHLGKIVRDGNICPVQVQTWKDIDEEVKDHLWDLVKERFEHEKMENYREATLEHMAYLWTAWRSNMYIKYVKPCKTEGEALKICPRHISIRDWKWLVNEKYFTEEFQRVSKRSIENRGKTRMPHRSGSKPYRAIMYDMGGKDGNPPDFPTLFFETRQKDGKLQDQESKKKYDELVKITKSHPSLSTIEVIDKCFGPQTHNNVVGYGGGVKRKHLAGSKSAYRRSQDQEMANKYEELVKITKSHPSLSTIEVIDKCFGPHTHKNIMGYRGGVKRKHLAGSKSAYRKSQDREMANKYNVTVETMESEPSPTEVIDKYFGPQSQRYGGGKKRKPLTRSKSAYEKELEAKLQDKEEENLNLKRRLERIESRLGLMENCDVQPSSVPLPTANIDYHEESNSESESEEDSGSWRC